MLDIWEKVSEPAPDGQRYIRWPTRADIDYLYETGFVDTDRFRKEEWFDAFKDSRQKGGSYIITKGQWMAKRAFRFNGPTSEPFEPLALREGEWEVEEFERILKEKLFPSTTLSEDLFRKAIDKRGEKAIVGGKFLVSKTLKFALKQALIFHPSPRRFRELAVSGAREEMKKALDASQKLRQGSASKSGYSSGPTNQRTTVDQLSKLLWKK
jgi:hypothetical protein